MSDLRRAVAVLEAGGVIAYPTEAVWGLGCDPLREDAVLNLLALKRRDSRKGLILAASSFAQLRPFIAAPTAALENKLTSAHAVPVTWVVPASELVSPLVSGGRDTVAVRVSRHPVVIALCEAFGGALVSTSANRSGRRAARSALQVRTWFGRSIDFVLNGPLGSAQRPSEIRDAITGQVVRRR